MKTRWLLSCGLATLAVVAIFAVQAGSAPSASPAEIGAAAPDFALKDVYGKEFKLSDFKGRVVVLEWLNQDCPVSKGKHNDKVMQKLYGRHADKGVIWLGIDSTYYIKPEADRVYAAVQGLAYPILHDPDGKVGHAYGARTTPHMYVIGKKGTLVYDGAIDDKKRPGNYVNDAIKAAVAGQTVAKAKTKPYGCNVKYASKSK